MDDFITVLKDEITQRKEAYKQLLNKMKAQSQQENKQNGVGTNLQVIKKTKVVKKLQLNYDKLENYQYEDNFNKEITDKLGDDLLALMSNDKYASEDDIAEDLLDQFLDEYNKIMKESEEYLMNVQNLVD